MIVTHAFDPICDAQCRALILGTMPSPASVERGFYYSHPRNRFWPVIAEVFGEDIPAAPEDKIRFLLRHHIAMWDVLKTCAIEGASDASIRKPEPNDIAGLLAHAPITHIYTTGRTATNLYSKLVLKQQKTGIEPVYLPSTSPAYAAMTHEALVNAYGEIKMWV